MLGVNARPVRIFLPYGVRQGSVRYPPLYLLYTVFPSDVLKSYDLSYHFYAYDSKYTCPFTVTREPKYSKSKRVSLTPVVG